jgi:glycolate oxidase iron-sulfur subunit
MQTRFTPAQLADPDLAASEQILRKCVHCGFCTATCPTYVLLGDELDSPRGRIYLIKDMLENSRPATQPIVQHIDRCLSCLACMTTCPSGVHYQHLIDHARVHVERTYHRPWREGLLRAVLARIVPYPRRLRAALALAALVRSVAPSGFREPGARENGFWAAWRTLLKLAAFSRRRSRNLPKHPERDGQPSTPTPRPSMQGRVALLAGCAQSVLNPEGQAAALRLIERAGFEVVRIEGCCGALVHHLGRAEQAGTLAARVLQRIEAELPSGGLDAVIVTASGCGTHLKDYGYLFRNDPQLAARARRASELAQDITEWLDARGWHPSAPNAGVASAPHQGLTVAYHSACSMQHGQKLDRIPQRLLERAGFVVREIPEGHLCCGSAGTYSILQPRLAAQLRDRKLENIRSTSARLVATGNVGCIVQLASAGDLAIVHTAELLDWAQGGPEPRSLSDS